MKTRNWYSGVFAGGHQGSVACQDTGKTIALSYDPADAPLLAAAPDLLAALQDLLAHEGEREFNAIGLELESQALEEAKELARAAIAKATTTTK